MTEYEIIVRFFYFLIGWLVSYIVHGRFKDGR